MLAFDRRPVSIRPALAREVGLIADLRLESLLGLEMPRHPLLAVRAVLTRLPDFDEQLVRDGHYVVADQEGDLLGGAGWSVLPLSFRAEHVLDERDQAAALRLGDGSVLVRGFFLDPDLGRRGLGASLLARIEADAAAAGYAAAELVVPAASQLYYRSMGFRPVGKLGLTLDRDGVLPLVQMRRCFPATAAWAA